MAARGLKRKKEDGTMKNVCIAITTLWAYFFVIGVQLCSTMTPIFLHRHFLIRLNGPRFDSGLHFFTRFLLDHYFSFLDILGSRIPYFG